MEIYRAVHQFSCGPTTSCSKSELRSTRVRIFYWCPTASPALAEVWVLGRSREEGDEPNVAPVDKTQRSLAAWVENGRGRP